jgi:hypothetical protein
MSLEVEKCLNAKVEGGRITRDDAEMALKLIKGLEERHARTMNQSAAEAKAAADAASLLQRRAAKAKEQTAKHILAVKRVVDQAAAHPKGQFAGVAAVFARDIWNEAGAQSLESRVRAVRSQLFGAWSDGLAAFRSRLLGFQQSAEGLQQFVRALYGETIKDEVAAGAAKTWGKMTNGAVDRFNAAGGDLTRKIAWRLPQTMNPNLLQENRGGWINYMTQAYHDGRVVVWDYEAGMPVNFPDFEATLTAAWDSITSHGMNDLVPGQARHGKLANSRLDSRVFEWQTADAWLDANRTWGVGDSGIYSLLIGHVDGMARDIGMMETLGPNPDLAARILIDKARIAGVKPLKANHLEAIYWHASGRASSPVSSVLANFAGGLRSWLTSANMGSAMISSTTDFATLKSTAKWNGLPSAKLIKRYGELLVPNEKRDRLIAARTGLIAETWLHAARGAVRNSVDENEAGFRASGLLGRASEVFASGGNRAAEAVIRGQGLARHTDAARTAFGLEYLSKLADEAHLDFAGLPAETRRSFEAYGITAVDWDRIRAHGVGNFDGVKFVFPEQLAQSSKAGEDVAARLLGMLQSETDFAVTAPGARERALLLGQSKRGTIGGEFRRAVGQYKSFPVTILTTHMMRGLGDIQKNGFGFGSYIVWNTVAMTLMGGLALQARQIAKGQDPRDMADPKFWGASFIQGGGAGILGDFLYAGVNRHQTGFYMATFGGPTAKFFDDVVGLTGWNLQGTLSGEDTNFGRQLARFVRSYTPGSSLWYSRLALDRLMWDQLQTMLDPKYAASFKRMEQRAKKDYGQSFWWRPGKVAPSRGPNLSTAIGG